MPATSPTDRSVGDRLFFLGFDAPGPVFDEAVARYAPAVRVRLLAPGDSINLPDRGVAAA
jgi:hypothetical protein